MWTFAPRRHRTDGSNVALTRHMLSFLLAGIQYKDTRNVRNDRYRFNSRCINKKHLKNGGPIRHCEPPHAAVLHCHSPGVATVASRLPIAIAIDVHNNNDNA